MQRATPTIISTGPPQPAVPMPKHRGWTLKLLELKPGESLLAQGNNASIRSTCCYLARVHRDYRFKTRTEGSKGGDTRVWRV